jgi:hypothetical protein
MNYLQVVQEMKTRYHVRVKRWRDDLSGSAWRAWYADGTQIAWIEAPLPADSLSLAVFLHEVGHHAVGFDRFRKRCEQEYHAWIWALDQMRQLGLEPDPQVRALFQRSIRFAVKKALARRIRALPLPLTQFALAA